MFKPFLHWKKHLLYASSLQKYFKKQSLDSTDITLIFQYLNKWKIHKGIRTKTKLYKRNAIGIEKAIKHLKALNVDPFG